MSAWLGKTARWVTVNAKTIKRDAAVVAGVLVAQPAIHAWLGKQHGLAATLIALVAGVVGVGVRTAVK